jgi:very-short-patch-repair endonuclease
MSSIPNDSQLLAFARNMRKHPTLAEKTLWRQLRANNLAGYHFKRQNPIGPYIVDFSCNELKLIIEVDGDSHAGQENQDEMRTADLCSLGYRVIRFNNEDVLWQLDSVIREIEIVCNELREGGRVQSKK